MFYVKFTQKHTNKEKFPNLREPIQNFHQNIIAVEEKEMIIQIGRKEH